MQWLALMMIGSGSYLLDCGITNRSPLGFAKAVIADPSNVLTKWQATKGTWIAPLSAMDNALNAASGTDDAGTPTGSETSLGWHPGITNGRLGAGDLATIPWAPGYKVYKGILPSLVAMNAAYKKEFGRNMAISSAYRNLLQQSAVRLAKPGLAAPSGSSYHGWGVAIDFGGGINEFGTKQYKWMVANSGKFGWFQPSWAQAGGDKPEAWHWQSKGTTNG